LIIEGKKKHYSLGNFVFDFFFFIMGFIQDSKLIT